MNHKYEKSYLFVMVTACSSQPSFEDRRGERVQTPKDQASAQASTDPSEATNSPAASGEIPRQAPAEGNHQQLPDPPKEGKKEERTTEREQIKETLPDIEEERIPSTSAIPPTPGLASRNDLGCPTATGNTVRPISSRPFLFTLPPDSPSFQGSYAVRCELGLYNSAYCWLTDQNLFPILVQSGAKARFEWSFEVKGCPYTLKTITPLCASADVIIAQEVVIPNLRSVVDSCRANSATLTFTLRELESNHTYIQTLDFFY